jgi:hypothetical protein
MASEALFLDLLFTKMSNFQLKVSFIEIDALPRHFPHDHEDKERGRQALLDLRWGEVRLSSEPQLLRSLSPGFAGE